MSCDTATSRAVAQARSCGATTLKPLPSDHFLYEPFQHTRGLGEKDLRLALVLGEELDVDLPLAELALENLAEGLAYPIPPYED